jgi:alkanesulfonate monooxygenase SsuD/methylene tetrahydromethanopterin reductase-like flavin-dependent oxidoreductase (luciferase family)
MFDIKQLPHDERYAASGEWVEIVTGLWDNESVTYEGSYFTVNDAQISPRPASRPVLVNAGVSPTGIDFAAKYTDFSFQPYPGEEMFAQNVSRVRQLAEQKYDRKLGVLTAAQIVCADTEAEAQRYYEYYVDEKGDFEGAEQAVSLLLGGDSRSFSREQFAHLQRSLVASFGSLCLVGTAEQIADRIVGLQGMGIDGLAVHFVDYAEGIDRFTGEIMPLLREAGLRR